MRAHAEKMMKAAMRPQQKVGFLQQKGLHNGITFRVTFIFLDVAGMTAVGVSGISTAEGIT
jgi:hypothetical protein